jgi:ferredoxin
MQVDVLGELGAYGEVRDLNCIRCLKCIDVCPSEVISFNFGQCEEVLSADVAARVEQASHKRRKSGGFDVAITALWIGVTVVMFFVGARQYAPQEVKVFMGPGLLMLVYGLVWAVYKVSNRLGFGGLNYPSLR